MILSHRHRFIFLKTNKTGSTSVEIALSRYCGPEDVITPISAADEALRQTLGFPGPQNHVVPLRRYRGRHFRQALSKGRRVKYYNHMPAAEVRLLAGESVWRSYFKFCFERSPWDRVLSLYFWRWPAAPRPTLDEFVASPVILNLKDKGAEIYSSGNDLLVDRVCRYEAFTNELNRLAADLHLPGPLDPPVTKARPRFGPAEAAPAPSAASLGRLRQMFAFELEHFGYRLPEAHEAGAAETAGEPL